MSQERRREPRLNTLPLNLLIYDNLSGELLGTMVNLSSNGMMILSSANSEPGGVLQIDIREHQSKGPPLLSAGVKINWVSAANTADNYWFGMQIIDISTADKQKLTDLLRMIESPGTD